MTSVYEKPHSSMESSFIKPSTEQLPVSEFYKKHYDPHIPVQPEAKKPKKMSTLEKRETKNEPVSSMY